MSECESCGREDGHHLGCPAVRDPLAAAFLVKLDEAAKANECAFGDCENPKRPKGKGPAPKYCTEHSDPKNRK
jgi:hypothetical protein